MKRGIIKYRYLLIVFTFAIFTTSCVSPEKLVETGNYDQAIELALRKLAGKKNKKVKYVRALEDAFAEVTERDMQAAERLKRQNRPENWVRIEEIYSRIGYRQERIEPLLPLVDKEGIKANFRFVRVDGLETEAQEKAAQFLYDNSQKLLVQARNGDKIAARNAFQDLDKIGSYYRNYKDRTELMEEAKSLGTSRVLVEVENRAPVVLPRDFESELKRINVYDLNSQWKEYYVNAIPGVSYDYKVIMNITRIEVTPSVVKERSYEDVREIEDGFEYILDENGNVKKDSLGNDIKVPKKVLVRAIVLETFQHKAASVAGHVEIVDLKTNRVLDTKSMAVDAIFENYASTFRGDKRALSNDSKRRIGNQPVPFPTEEMLLLDAADRLKPVLKSKIEATRIMI